jgi:DNA-binding NarL/FixJ family response regulator
MARIRVLVAEDHTVVAEGFRALLRDAFDLTAIVHDGRALVEAVVKLQPDVVVTDISMPQLNGLEAIRQIRTLQTPPKIVVLTMHRETELAVEAFRAGALGYVLKVSPGDELITAIREVAQGRAFVSSLVSKDLLSLLLEARSEPRSGPPLTPRQREVLQLVAEGRTMKEVASILRISPRTAESHKYEIMQALGVPNTAGLVQYAIRMKLLSE